MSENPTLSHIYYNETKFEIGGIHLEQKKAQKSKEEKRIQKRSEKREWKQHKKSWKKKHPFWRVLRVTSVSILVLGGVAIGGYQLVIHSDVYHKLATESYDILATMEKGTFRSLTNTKILDKDNQLIGEVDSGTYLYKDISSIPLSLQNAYIAAEDQNFKTHRGVDYKAILRAGITLVKNKGEITQGGSTITQQVIKNNLLSQEQSFVRKILEILIAPELEKEYSKQELMEFYCNSNYYGNGCYGVGSASRFYFGKDVSELTLAESAMMAGISNSPNNYNPVADFEKATKKKEQILKQMLEQQMITEEEYKLAKDQEIVVTQTSSSLVSADNYMSSYAIHCATLELMELNGFEFDYLFETEEEETNYETSYSDVYKKCASEIRSGGYTIHTSFDQNIQKQLQESIDQQLASDTQVQENGKYRLQSAGVCIDNESGYVVAIVGGRGEDTYNRGFLAVRQPGSAIKPLLVYGPAFNEGKLLPSMIYEDKKLNINGYSPKNAGGGYQGAMTIRKAIASSRNTIPVQILNEIGTPAAMGYLEKMKFSHLGFSDTQSLSTALGGFSKGVQVDEMARAYAVLANSGKDVQKTCIVSIEHEKKGVVYSGEKEIEKEIFQQDAAFMLTDCLQGVIKESYGTGHSINLHGQIAAVKTGTTDLVRDSWLCGYTPYYTTAVWVGNDDNTPMSESSFAKNIWADFMNALGKPATDFIIPSTIQYRKLDASGNPSGDVADSLDDTLPVYERRPEGYDMTSLSMQDSISKNLKKKELEAALEAAQQAVSAFELVEITDSQGVLDYDSAHQTALTAIDAIPDEYQRAEFQKRVVKKEKQLAKTYKAWKKKIAEAAEQEQEQATLEQAKQDEQNEQSSYQKLQEQRVSYVRQYIQMLSEREYNTKTTQTILKDAWKRLENCAGYAEYDSLKEELQAQETRILELPTQIPKPEVPENELDVPPDTYPEDKPEEDAEPKPEEKPEEP